MIHVPWTDPRTWVNGEIPTQTEFNTHVRDNTREIWRELAYVEFTADVVITTGTEAVPIDVVSSGAITYVANPIRITFECSQFDLAAGVSASLSLWDGATDLGRIWNGNADNTSGAGDGGVSRMRRLTPTAASHTYKIRGWTVAAGVATVKAGAGGVGIVLPGHILVEQKGGA